MPAEAVPLDVSLDVALDATPLLDRPTGVGVFCRGALSALARRDDVAVSAYAVSWRRRGLLADRLPPGVRLHQRAMPARPLQSSWRRWGRPPVEWFTGRSDVVHGTNYVVPPTASAAPVVTVFDLTTLRYPELCHPATLVFPELVRAAVRRGAWVHTTSSFVAGEVREAFDVPAERVRTVLLGVPPVAGAAPVAGVAPVDPPAGGSGGRYVLAIGTAEPRKDLPGLVRAFDQLAPERPDLRLVLAGPPGWGSDELADAVAASPARDRIRTTGWLDDERLGTLLRGAAVLAFPSLYEGFGFPPLQAMGVGVPVVASTAGSLPEVLGDAALLVPPADPAALAGALAQVLDDPATAGRLTALGRRRVAELSWEACAEGLVRLYRDAVAEHRPA